MSSRHLAGLVSMYSQMRKYSDSSRMMWSWYEICQIENPQDIVTDRFKYRTSAGTDVVGADVLIGPFADSGK